MGYLETGAGGSKLCKLTLRLYLGAGHHLKAFWNFRFEQLVATEHISNTVNKKTGFTLQRSTLLPMLLDESILENRQLGGWAQPFFLCPSPLPPSRTLLEDFSVIFLPPSPTPGGGVLWRHHLSSWSFQR